MELIQAPLHESQCRMNRHVVTYLSGRCDGQNKGGNCRAAQIEQTTLEGKREPWHELGYPSVSASNVTPGKQMRENFIPVWTQLVEEESQFQMRTLGFLLFSTSLPKSDKPKTQL